MHSVPIHERYSLIHLIADDKITSSVNPLNERPEAFGASGLSIDGYSVRLGMLRQAVWRQRLRQYRALEAPVRH